VIKRSFAGGVHPYEGKHFTEKKKIEILPNPQKVFVPLQQHIGTPTKPLVNKGDEVRTGQKIGEMQGFVSSPVHSPFSGKVKNISEIDHPVSGRGQAIVIEIDDAVSESDALTYQENYFDLTVDEMKTRIKEAGITGLGGATFPTHVKLSPPPDKKIDTVILNGAECEPYLTADHRLMLEHPEEIVRGLQIIMKILDVTHGIIGIENNKMDAFEILKKIIKGDAQIDIILFPVKYPQGAEKQLIKAALKREVPSGGLPMAVGVVVHNVGTAKAVYEAVAFEKPLTHRVVTVTGSGVKESKNVLVPIGTIFQDVIDFCGGLTQEAVKIIMGGPMMGLAQSTTKVPVIKGTSGILIFEEKYAHIPQQEPCINCGRCVEVCPMGLLPTSLQLLVEHEKFIESDRLNVMDCMECGSCSYICPSNRYLLHAIRFGKKKVLELHKKAS
jgi:electron transport complex protein RnfC